MVNIYRRLRHDPLFPIAQGLSPWQPILRFKWAKSADTPLFVALSFRKGLQYRNSDFKRVNGNEWMTWLYRVKIW